MQCLANKTCSRCASKWEGNYLFILPMARTGLCGKMSDLRLYKQLNSPPPLLHFFLLQRNSGPKHKSVYRVFSRASLGVKKK